MSRTRTQGHVGRQLDQKQREQREQREDQPDPDAWWRHGVVYQVYPRSFQDSDGDGVGDLAGIAARLDYLQDLGVDAVWISPIYPSPMADFGYDVADYCDVDSRFGTLDDFDALVTAAHERSLKVILDFVPNHTSDRHPWFVESRRGRDSELRDFYLWRDPAPDGGPPNNWRSHFGGPAWTFDDTSHQYYAHSFLPQQPDLNWRNPQVRQRMVEAMRFWLRRGADGFRVDVLWLLIKDEQFHDNPRDPAWHAGMAESKSLLPIYSGDRPEIMEVVKQMRSVVAEFDTAGSSRILIGELYLPIERLAAYHAPDDAGVLRGVQLPFNFHLIAARWQAAELAELIRRYEASLPAGGWPNWVLGNHDQPRIASRVGEAGAALAALLLLTLRGTPTMYYGDEIALQDVPVPAAMQCDPAGLRQPGLGLGRDPQRTPMPWDAGAGAGFTTGRPWLPLNADHGLRNVAQAASDPRSLLSLYRTLLVLRRQEPALHRGAIEAVTATGECLAFERVSGASRLRVELNFGSAPAAPAAGRPRHQVLFTTAGFGVAGIGDKSAFPLSRSGGDDDGGAYSLDGAPCALAPLTGRILRVS